MLRRILVIENDQEDRRRIKKRLERNSFEVIEAASEKEGLQKYLENRPDAILVRLMMEKMDSGIEVVKNLRQLNNKAPVFLMSRAANYMAGEMDFLKLGFSALLQKPVDCDNLIKMLNKVLR